MYCQWRQGTTPWKLVLQTTKTLVVASKWGCSDFMCTCLHTNSTMKLNQKLSKSMPRKRSLWDIYMKDNTCARNWQLKWRGCISGEYGKYTGQRKHWKSLPQEWTLVHQQAFLHQLHPTSPHTARIDVYAHVTHSICLHIIPMLLCFGVIICGYSTASIK